MKSPALKKSYYPALDGLRGLAILAVLFQHDLSFLPFSGFGWIGVDLFFVLSGFLITDILLKSRQQKDFLPRFYVRRILRIFPLYYGAIIVFFLVAPFIGQLRDQFDYYASNQTMLWLYVQNWLYIIKPRPHNYVLTHFWSLSVEEQFYLVWPLMILVCKKINRLIAFCWLLFFSCIAYRFVSWCCLGNSDTNFLLQYMTRADGLCLGSLIAIWRNTSAQTAGRKLFRMGFIVLGLHGIVCIFSKTIFRGLPHFPIFGYASIAVIFGMVLHLVVEKKNALTTMLFENRVLKGLGKISYGLYVYHWPILVLSKIFLVNYLEKAGWSIHQTNIIACICALALAILVSLLSYSLLEKRILAFKERVTTAGSLTRFRQKLVLRLNSRRIMPYSD